MVFDEQITDSRQKLPTAQWHNSQHIFTIDLPENECDDRTKAFGYNNADAFINIRTN